MAFRIIKTTLHLLFIFVLIWAIAASFAFSVSSASKDGALIRIPTLSESGIIENVFGEIPEDATAINPIFIVRDLVDKALVTAQNNIHATLSAKSKLTWIGFGVMLWLFSLYAMKGSAINRNAVMSKYTLGLGHMIAKKVMTFPKENILLKAGLFIVTLPVFLFLKLLFRILHILVAPVAYIALSYVNAVRFKNR